MALLAETLIEHTLCPPRFHRRDATPDEPHTNGHLVCDHCGNPLAFCAATAAANNATGGGYQRVYFHPNPAHEESCS